MAVSPGIKNLIGLAKAGKYAEFQKDYMTAFPGSSGADIGIAYMAFSFMDENAKDPNTSRINTAYDRPSSTEGWVERFLKTQADDVSGDRGEFLTIEKGMSTFFDEKGQFRGVKDSLKEIAAIIPEQIIVGLQQSTDLLHEINKTTGLTGKLSREFRDEIKAASPDVIRLGISFSEMSTSVSKLLEESGKFRLINRETIAELGRASVFADSMEDLSGMADDFENVGLGVKDMTREIELAGHSSLEVGLNAKKTVKLIDENLGNINKYGFKGGIQGMTTMAQKAIEFRMNMSETFKLAEKVWSPEGALDVVANLQMIGGAFGDLNDPIKLMYMATNNVEGLQDALIGASKTLVTFNQEQGRFQITGANLRRAKEMAETMGVSIDELTKGAVASAERIQSLQDLASRGLNMDDKDQEFLTNLAQMKDGKMVIEVPEDLQEELGGKMVTLENLSQQQADLLLQNREEFKKMSTEDIMRSQYTAIENIMHDVSFITAKARIGVGKELGDAIETFISPGLKGDKISEESERFFSKFGKWMDGGQKWVSDAIDNSGMGKILPGKNIQGKITAQPESESAVTIEKMKAAEEKKKAESPVTPPPQTIYHIHKAGSAIMDGFTREMMKNSAASNREQYTAPATEGFTLVTSN